MPLQVDVVATDRRVWSGPAQIIVMRTLDGELGVLPGHAPLLALLADGPVAVTAESGEVIRLAIHGGFAIVDSDEVILLADTAERDTEIDVARARRARELAVAAGDEEGVRRSDTRLLLAGQAVAH
ncbi:MAG: F0F1 ATP synthase subunit epsilon [Actinomycetales bacterium]|nr:F0F1 ATP synthase subunit epsilon [Actinomycetales bacterium]